MTTTFDNFNSNLSNNLKSLISDGLKFMEITLKEEQIQKLLTYLRTLHKWNQTYNLSAIRDPEAMVRLHLLDSLALVPHLQKFIQQRCDPVELIDVGSGGGLPGLPLAIACPQASLTLLDSNGKKTRFLFQTALKLGLCNVEVINRRVEKYSPEHKFTIVVSRAFASIEDMIQYTNHLLSEDGEYWAMKGVYPELELVNCTAVLTRTHRLDVPGCKGERHLLVLKSTN